MRHQVRLEGFVTPQHARSEYLYLPFDMPAGARRVEVNYFYENQVTGAQETHAGNNIDIGVFDTRGTDFLTGGFRGWSGGARTGFYLERERATPGYLRGPLQPGEWNIIFCCSKIDDEIVRYRVNVEIDLDPDAADEPVANARVPERPRPETDAPRRTQMKRDPSEPKTLTEEAAAGTADPDVWELRLYVAGKSAKSVAAFDNLKRLCEEHLPGKYKIEVVDLRVHPQLAKGDQIVAIPTLVRKLPEPIRKVIGDLSNIERALVGLQLRPAGGW